MKYVRGRSRDVSIPALMGPRAKGSVPQPSTASPGPPPARVSRALPRASGHTPGLRTLRDWIFSQRWPTLHDACKLRCFDVDLLLYRVSSQTENGFQATEEKIEEGI
ncbi:hypothetical protein EVAR_82689_1 [Eumeta japonica]|uniref:Uncharacterized protein n=1 Tax=Eumeta variegata TaxID=151549 RepID=A0A4C1VCT8_EUMVA|nr:hypothetical protein EVAR_82689_1 [Eumeta japonica]